MEVKTHSHPPAATYLPTRHLASRYPRPTPTRHFVSRYAHQQLYPRPVSLSTRHLDQVYPHPRSHPHPHPHLRTLQLCFKRQCILAPQKRKVTS